MKLLIPHNLRVALGHAFSNAPELPAPIKAAFAEEKYGSNYVVTLEEEAAQQIDTLTAKLARADCPYYGPLTGKELERAWREARLSAGGSRSLRSSPGASGGTSYLAPRV